MSRIRANQYPGCCISFVPSVSVRSSRSVELQMFPFLPKKIQQTAHAGDQLLVRVFQRLRNLTQASRPFPKADGTPMSFGGPLPPWPFCDHRIIKRRYLLRHSSRLRPVTHAASPVGSPTSNCPVGQCAPAADSHWYFLFCVSKTASCTFPTCPASDRSWTFVNPRPICYLGGSTQRPRTFQPAPNSKGHEPSIFASIQGFVYFVRNPSRTPDVL
jgi:hypothetical protein